jgi:valyl-tRNA synthetase
MIVEKYGTDAVRFTLASMASPGTDIAFSEARTEGYRAFANKIWNAARFIFMNVERAREAGMKSIRRCSAKLRPFPQVTAVSKPAGSAPASTPSAAEVNAALADYRFDEAANLVYQFFWGDFCDWYLEIVKLRLDFADPPTRPQPIRAHHAPPDLRIRSAPALALHALPHRRALARTLRR